MTRDDAVMTIIFLKEDYKQLLTEEDAEALSMAIEALQTQDEPVICESEGKQAKPVTKGEYMAFKGIKRMSHVDPEETADRDFMELIDTITKNTMASVIVIPYEALDISTNTPTNTPTDRPTKSTNIPTEPTTEALKREPSEDLIKRSDAIEAIEIVDWYHQNRNKDMVNGANSDEHQAWYKADDVYKALEAVPPANRPKGEPKTGKWINTAPSYRSDNIVCNQCGYNSIARYDYCPNCGTKMDGERIEE